MLQFGFHHKWVDLMMLCITSVKYKVINNGYEIGPIIPQRGLRQGDPLSPYLFLICAEGLTSILQIAVQRTSGQKVNFDKSSISSSANVSNELKNTLCEVLGVNYTTNHGKYLGLPSLIGRNKREVFDFIKEKAWGRMNGWRNKFLSRARKEILLKAVVQAIPSYVMSVFSLPINLCDELERMMNSFWWVKSGQNERGLRWKCWTKLYWRKEDGRLGFRKLHDFNTALLAKQGWKLLSKPCALASQVLKARYFPQCNFLHAEIGHNPSYVWRSIWSTQGLLRQGARIRIGSGKQTCIWKDPWLPDKINPFISSGGHPDLINLTVGSLRVAENGAWDLDIVRDLFSERDQQLIISLPLSHHERDDKWMWEEEKLGEYSVKSGYKTLMNADWWNHLANNCELNKIGLAATILWCVWKNKNDVVWNGRCKLATVIFQSAFNIHSQWLMVKQVGAQPSSSTSQIGFRRWKKPPENVLKCNVDAAVIDNYSHFGYGCVLRNTYGVVIAATHGRLQGHLNAMLAEALSIREALSWLKSLGFSHIIVESDALLVIEALNNSSESDSSILGLIVDDCKILAGDFSSCQFVFVYRSANQIAHALARKAISMSGLLGRATSSPTFISSVILQDLV
ncbi:uncharacterized protein [Henckelia pumila]|uniref:uncharacterized protein n=1 Tax=Henckelia pumila TaxID=405737 RepID=UPI003C6E1283